MVHNIYPFIMSRKLTEQLYDHQARFCIKSHGAYLLFKFVKMFVNTFFQTSERDEFISGDSRHFSRFVSEMKAVICLLLVTHKYFNDGALTCLDIYGITIAQWRS